MQVERPLPLSTKNDTESVAAILRAVGDRAQPEGSRIARYLFEEVDAAGGSEEARGAGILFYCFLKIPAGDGEGTRHGGSYEAQIQASDAAGQIAVAGPAWFPAVFEESGSYK